MSYLEPKYGEVDHFYLGQSDEIPSQVKNCSMVPGVTDTRQA